MGLIKEFQRDIVTSNKSVTELLRTAKLISAKLGLTDISEWIRCELEGYPAGDVPSYRMMKGATLRALNPYRGWTPGHFLDTELPMKNAVPHLEELVRAENIGLPLSGDQKFRLVGSLGYDLDWEQMLQIDRTQVQLIITAVRDKLLDWSLELEKRGIKGDDMTFDDREKQSAKNQTFHIQNFTGVLGDVSHSNFDIYNYNAIDQTLRDQKIPKEQRRELEDLMDELKTSSNEAKPKLLERAKAWVIKNQDLLGASVSLVRKVLGLPD